MRTTAEHHFHWQNLIVLWLRRTAPRLATPAWQCLLSGGNCYPGLPYTVYTQWSILRHARPPCPVHKHWGFHDVYSVYTGVSLNKTSMNAGSPENWWIRLDHDVELLAFWTILTQARLIKHKYLCCYGVLCTTQEPSTQSLLNIMIQHRFVIAIKTFSEKELCVCRVYVYVAFMSISMCCKTWYSLLHSILI